MCLFLTASPENSVTKLSCSTVKSSTVNMKDSFCWKRLHSIFLENDVSNVGGKALLFRLFIAMDNNAWIEFHCSVYGQLHLPDKTRHYPDQLWWHNQEHTCIFSLRECKSTSKAKARNWSLKCMYGSQKCQHYVQIPCYFPICQQILQTVLLQFCISSFLLFPYQNQWKY